MVRVRTLMFVIAMLLAVALTIAVTQAVAPPGGPSEGIGVHGQWTIDVHDADGSLAASHEFDNAFVGGESLANLMSGAVTHVYLSGVPDWAIEVNGVINEDVCVSSTGAGTRCLISQPGSLHGGFDTLTVSSNSAVTSLQGSFAPEQDGRIGSVRTLLRVDDGTNAIGRAFTHKVFDADGSTTDTSDDAIPVADGQFVTVTVDISFSDAPA